MEVEEVVKKRGAVPNEREHEATTSFAGAVKLEDVKLVVKGVLKVKREKEEFTFDFEFHPNSKKFTVTDWYKLSSNTLSERHILCYYLKNIQTDVISLISSSTEALVLINEIDNYQLNVNKYGIEDMDIPVAILKISDGSKIFEWFEAEQLQATICDVDDNLMANANLDHYQRVLPSPDLAEFRQRRQINPKEILLSFIHEHMLINNCALPLLQEHTFPKFKKLFLILDLHNKELVKRLKISDVNEIIDKLSKHSETCFGNDFLVYAMVIEVMTRSVPSAKSLTKWISGLLTKVEEIDLQTVARQVSIIVHGCENEGSGVKDSMFLRLHIACYNMTALYFKNEKNNCQRTPLYSNMLWISLAMKFQDLGTHEEASFWKNLFFLCQNEIILEDNTCNDIADCLKLCKMLKISSKSECKCEDFVQILTVTSETKHRLFSELRIFINLLKTHFQCSCNCVHSLMSSVREKYYSINCPVWDDFKNIMNTDLLNNLAEGIEFLETLFEFFGEVPELKKEVMEWTKQLLYLIDIKSKMLLQVQYYSLFINGEKKVLRENHQEICQTVVKTVSENFNEITCKQFLVFHKKFPHISEQNLMVRFLIEFKIPNNFGMEWQEFFEEFAKYEDKFELCVCFFNFLQCCFDKFKMEESIINFMVHLVKFETENILSGLKEEDKGILDNISTLINDNIKTTRVRLCTQITEILNNMKPVKCILYDMVAEAITKWVFPEIKKNFHKYGILFENCAYTLINDLTWISKTPNTKLHLCWSIVIFYCPEFDGNMAMKNLDWVSDIRKCISIVNFFKIYEAMRDQSIVPSSPEIERYFIWMSKLKKILNYWIDKFKKREVSFGSIVNFDRYKYDLKFFRNKLHLSAEIPDSSDIEGIKRVYESKFSLLLSLLVKCSISKSHMLHELLQKHDVEVPGTIVTFIMNRLVYFTKQNQLLNSEAENVLSEECKGYVISIHKDCTLVELSDMCSVMKEFQEPLEEHLDMFVYFSVEESILFQNYLNKHRHQIEQQSNSLDLSFQASLYSCNSDFPETETISIENFCKILGYTKGSIHDILLGKTTYSEITSSVEMAETKFLSEEIPILHNYVTHTGLGESYQKGLEDVESMLQLFQYSPCIISLCEIFKTFETFNSLHNDSNLEPLFSFAEEMGKKSSEQLTALQAKEKLQMVKRILALEGSLKCLVIFPAILKSREFYKFLCDQQFNKREGHERFKQKYSLVTAQLQHEEYNETVLNHLWVAYKIMVPFLNPTNLKCLINEIKSLTKGTNQLKTVNQNLALIWKWFSKAEGNTRDNIAKELKDIMESGNFCFEHKKEESNIHMQKVELMLLYNSSVYSPSLQTDDENSTKTKQLWNSEQINEFVRKLGFLDKDNVREDSFKNFLNLSKMAYKMLEYIRDLTGLGYPTSQIAPISCSISHIDMVERITDMKQRVMEWKGKTSEILNQHQKLLLMTMPKLLQLYGMIIKFDSVTDDDIKMIVHEVSFLLPNTISIQKKLQASVKGVLESIQNPGIKEPLSSMILVGKFLDKLLIDDYLPLSKSTLNAPNIEMYKSQPLYSCSLSGIEVICLIIGIFNGLPEPYQVLRCQASTSEHEITLFWKRLSVLKDEYLVLNFDKLPLKLQELIVHFHMNTQNEKDTPSVIHFLETSKSILHEIPWVELKDINSIKVSEKVAQEKGAARREKFATITLVHGKPGCGKTHFIKKQLMNSHNHLTIAINEEFTPLKAISKLKSLPLYEEEIGIYFNITVLPPGNFVEDEETKRYLDLMNSISWFFFDLLLLGYVEDKESGLSFCIPGELRWKIYIEVPSHGSCYDEVALHTLKDVLPSLFFLGSHHCISQCKEFELDDDVQLVCKYLQAYSDGTINKLYKEGGPPIQFSQRCNFTVSKCKALLEKYMPSHIKESMVTQKLFIRYMKRRCKFLDELPAFQYNIGRGDVSSRIPITGGILNYYDTKRLGSVLMSAMLREVDNFCDPNIAKKSIHSEYQQLIYDFKDGGSSFGLLSMGAYSKKSSEFEEFKQLGIEPLSLHDLNTREVQDKFLSRALNLKLNSKGRISAIDDKPYVLTLDYTVKMLNIHERRECGMPVILEGETGVGKTALVEMLSDLWSQSMIMEWYTQKDRLLNDITKMLKRSHVEQTHEHTYSVHTITFHDVEYLCGTKTERCKRILKKIMPLKKNPMLHLLTTGNVKIEGPSNSSLDILDLFDQASQSISSTAKLLYYILKSEVQSTFHKINVHGALTVEQIWKLFQPVINQAKLLNSLHKRLDRGRNIYGCPYYTTVFFDEVNTASCLGLFKEIITDRTFDGVSLPDNIFIVAACNPHRGNSLASHETWIRGTYYVRSLHPSLHLLMWNYDSLTESQEKNYILAKFAMQNNTLHKNMQVEMTALIVDSQKKMREYAKEQLMNNSECLEFNEENIQKSSHSCVSQRDIQRVFTIYDWFLKFYLQYKHHGQENYERRAVLLAIGIVYYLRLDSQYRQKYIDHLNASTQPDKLKFSKAFNDELDFFIKEVKLPRGTAHTVALKENILATIVCTLTHTPLIIVGDPGSSKTFSFNQCVSNLKGEESVSRLFQNTQIFASLDPHFYQCSYQTTSNEIETVFSRAINRQRSYCQSDLRIYCVVFMDEAGLPEESHESLKALHHHLDKNEVSFVAITNHALDAAKTNRAISLFRPKASLPDLEELVYGCLDDKDSKIYAGHVAKFCKPYMEFMKEKWFSHLFGLRDFHHFIIHLRRNVSKSISASNIFQALKRNFSGSDRLNEICDAFFAVYRETPTSQLSSINQGVVEVFRESLHDCPASQTEFETNPVRYKLVIESSEDNSIIHILFSKKSANISGVRMFFCSSFQSDGELETVNTIAAIRHCAGEGYTVVMCQTDDIHSSFYDLFNQRFRKIDSESGPTYYCNIAIGAHSEPSRVHPNFQCVLVIRKSEIDTTPGPLLNRFEKYLITHQDILDMSFGKFPRNMVALMEAAKNKVEEFLNTINGVDSLYGYQQDTLNSLLLDMMPCMEYQYSAFEKSQYLKKSSEKPFDFLCKVILEVLRQNSGFNIPKYTKEEFYLDTDNIYNLLVHMNINVDLETDDDTLCAIEEAFSALIYDSHEYQDISPDGVMTIWVVEQLIIRVLLKRLMQVMTPEAIILKRNAIPLSYLLNYLKFQSHFSLRETVTNSYYAYQHALLKKTRSPNKLIVFTRSSSLIHDLPQVFPSNNDMYEDKHKEVIYNYIFEESSKLMLHKLSNILSQSSVEEILNTFMESDNKEILVLVANMQSTSTKIVNHTRFMIEEAESHKGPKKCKLFVFVLHFSPNQFFSHCYPTLFLREWDHYYLDTVAITPGEVDIPNWLQQCCFDSNEFEIESNDSLYAVVKELLENIIPILSARMTFGNRNERPFNCSMKPKERETALKTILNDYGLGENLCKRFCDYWSPAVMIEHLERTAAINKKRDSMLNITDSIQTQLKAQFLYFCIYMLSLANEDYNLDVLFTYKPSSNETELFLDVFKCLPLPELDQLIFLCSNLSLPKAPNQSYCFPFFGRLFKKMERYVDLSHEAIDSMMGPRVELESRTSMFSDSNQILQKMTDELFTTIQEEDSEVLAAVNATGKSLILWNYYLDDYFNYKVNLQNLHENNTHPFEHMGSKILQNYFEQLSNNQPKRLVKFHCYARIFNVNIAQMANILRPLEMTKKLPVGVHSFSETFNSEARNTLAQTLDMLKFDIGKHSHMATFILLTLLEGLLTATYSTASLDFGDKDDGKLTKWFRCYWNILSLCSFKQKLYSMDFKGKETLQAQFDIMQAIFIMILCNGSLSENSLCMAAATFHILTTTYFDIQFELSKEIAPNLKQILKTMLEVSFAESFRSNHQCNVKVIMEELLKHFFSRYKIYYNEEDVEWFFSIINSQTQYFPPYCDNPGKEEEASHFKHVGFCQLKLYVQLILQSKKQQKLPRPAFWHLTNCDLVKRDLIKKCLLQFGNEVVSSSYVPFYYEEYKSISIEFIKQPLCHVYFLVTMENIMKLTKEKDNNILALVELADTIHQTAETTQTTGKDILLQLELQAVVQVILQYLAKHIDCDVPDKFDDIHPHLEDIMRIIEYSSCQDVDFKGHQRVLMFHLLKSLNGIQNLIANSNFLKQFKILDQVILQDLEKTRLFQFHQLSILKEENIHKLYNLVSGIMDSIHTGKKKIKDLVKISQAWRKKKDINDGISAFRMVVWFVTCNNYYFKKISSPLLCSAFEDSNILGDRSCSQLIQCFLDTSRMPVTQAENDQLQSMDQSLIYRLFNPSQTEDQSDKDLKYALVNLVGVILGSSSQSNHLWYHLFSINQLENTYMTGFMYDHPVGSEGYTYDYGTELTLNGDFARRDFKKHAYRGAYSHHSLYLLLWANFGTFCIALLTQKDAVKELSGSIINKHRNPHNYCFEQMQMLWKMLKDKLKLSEERRSHFITLTLEKLYEVHQNSAKTINGIFKTSEELLVYEKKWHTCVYKPAWDEALDKYIHLFNERDHQVYLNIWEVEEMLPIIPCEEDLIHYILSQNLEDISENGPFNCVLRFTIDLKRLQIGGELLPDLIELYRWIHTNLSLRVTRQKAASFTIKNVLDIAIKRISEDAGDHLRKLFGRIQSNCIRYYDSETSAIESIEATNRRKRIVFNNKTPLLHVLSDTELEDQGKDYLYKFINEIIFDHNETIQRFNAALKVFNPSLHLNSLLEIHPNEVNLDCVLISSKEEIDLFCVLLQSRYVPSFTMNRNKIGIHRRKELPYFDLHGLVEDVAINFICGKPLIRSETSFRSIFKYSKEKKCNETAELNVLETTLASIKKQLPVSFKLLLPSDVLNELLYEFHSASYIVINDTMTFLGTVCDHLMKTLQQNTSNLYEEVTISDFAIQVYEANDFQIVLKYLNFHPGSEKQKKILESMKLKFVCGVFEFLYNWLVKGFYNFSSLPRYFKVNMTDEIRHKIEVDLFLQVKKDQKVAEMKKEVQKIIGAFKLIQSQLVKDVKEVSIPIIKVLLERKIIEEDSLIQKHLPTDIKLHHYVDFQISLGKLLDTFQQETTEQSTVNKWPEFVHNLWEDYLPHVREIIFKMENMDFFTRQNLEVYGFPIQNDDTFEDGLRRDLEMEPSNTQDRYAHDCRNAKDLAQNTTTTHVCSFLKDIDLQQYEENFRENDVDGLTLYDINPEDLEDAGVLNPVHQILISQLFKRKMEGTVPKFTARHITEFLSKIDLEKYASTLEKSGIDGDMLIEVNQDVMKKALIQLGVRGLAARKICTKFESYYSSK